MIERKIERKKNKKSYLLILITLLAFAAFAYLVSTYWAKVDTTTVKETTPPKVSSHTSTPFQEINLPALKRFRQFVAKSSKYKDPDPIKYAKQGTLLMSESLIAMAERYDIDDVGMEYGRDMLKDRAAELKAASGEHLTEKLKDSLEGNMDILKGLMKRNTPNIEHANTSLLESGFQMTTKIEELSNEAYYQFFKSAQDVMRDMAVKMEERKK